MANKKALVLEGGGLRGIFSAGVLDCFMDNDIRFDYVVGVSAGACNTFAYIANERGYIKKAMTQKNRKDSFYGLPQMVESHKFVNLEKVFYEYTKKYNFSFENFLSSKVAWEMVATNIQTGKAEYLHSNELDKARLIGTASCSLPLLTDPVEIDGQLYLDGGMADSIPFQRALDLGYNKIVVVCTRKKGNFSKVSTAQKPMYKSAYRDYPEFLKTVNKRTALYRRQIEQVESQAEHGDAFLIRPTLPEVGRLENDLDELSLSYYHGYTKALEYLDNLKRYLQ